MRISVYTTLLTLVALGAAGPARARSYELIRDPAFALGFDVTFGAEGAAPKHIYDIGNDPAKGSPVWQIMQWHSQASVPAHGRARKPGEGEVWANDFKRVTRIDGKLRLAMNSHREWEDYLQSAEWQTLRGQTPGLTATPFTEGGKKVGELPSSLGPTGWPALLVGQGFAPGGKPSYPPVSALKSLRLDLTARLVSIDRPIPETLPHPMAAQVPLFFSVQQLAGGEGFGQYILIAVPIFDSRFEFSPGATMLDPGLGAFMYGTASKFWAAKSLYGKQPVRFHGDALSFVRDSLKDAIAKGRLKDPDFSHYYVSGFNVGWEMPGLYDAEFELSAVSLTLEDDAK